MRGYSVSQCAFLFFASLIVICAGICLWQSVVLHRNARRIRRTTRPRRRWPVEQHPAYFMPSRRWPTE